MRVLFAGGGTAGHINPAISIAQYISARRPGTEIRFVGTKAGLEGGLVPKAGYELSYINVKGFKRKLTLENISALYHSVASLWEAKALLKEFQPDIVVGTGGYVSGPMLLMASRMGIPTAIHEQNAYPGVTSRLLSRFVDRVMISFEDSARYFGGGDKVVVTGNPIREEMLFTKKDEARRALDIDDTPFVVSFAGSLGARRVNETMADFIALHVKDGGLRHWHATGKYGWRWMPGLMKEKGIELEKYPQVRLQEYIHNMPTVMAAADLVICRAGAITLAELAAQGKPAILIPSPNVTHNHQYHNAMALVRRGAAEIITEKELTPKLLYERVTELLSHPERMANMSENVQKMAILNSTERIYEILTSLLKKGR